MLGLPHLDYSADTRTCRLVDPQRQLDAALRLTMPERVGSVRTLGDVREADRRRRERQHQVPPASVVQPEAARERGMSVVNRSAKREQQLTRR